MVFFSFGMSWLDDVVVRLTLSDMGPLTSCDFRPQKGAEVTELVMGQEDVETTAPPALETSVTCNICSYVSAASGG